MSWKYVLAGATLAAVFFQVSAEASENNDLFKAADSKSALLKVGEPFLTARSRILGSGWHMLPTPRNYEYMGTEKELADRKFLEVAYCSTDRGSLCVLYYRKGASCLRVGTIGERLKYMKITYWTQECPDVE